MSRGVSRYRNSRAESERHFNLEESNGANEQEELDFGSDDENQHIQKSRPSMGAILSNAEMLGTPASIRKRRSAREPVSEADGAINLGIWNENEKDDDFEEIVEDEGKDSNETPRDEKNSTTNKEGKRAAQNNDEYHHHHRTNRRDNNRSNHDIRDSRNRYGSENGGNYRANSNKDSRFRGDHVMNRGRGGRFGRGRGRHEMRSRSPLDRRDTRFQQQPQKSVVKNVKLGLAPERQRTTSRTQTPVGEQLLKCELCQFMTETKSSMRRHMKQRHSSSSEFDNPEKGFSQKTEEQQPQKQKSEEQKPLRNSDGRIITDTDIYKQKREQQPKYQNREKKFQQLKEKKYHQQQQQQQQFHNQQHHHHHHQKQQRFNSNSEQKVIRNSEGRIIQEKDEDWKKIKNQLYQQERPQQQRNSSFRPTPGGNVDNFQPPTGMSHYGPSGGDDKNLKRNRYKAVRAANFGTWKGEEHFQQQQQRGRYESRDKKRSRSRSQRRGSRSIRSREDRDSEKSHSIASRSASRHTHGRQRSRSSKMSLPGSPRRDSRENSRRRVETNEKEEKEDKRNVEDMNEEIETKDTLPADNDSDDSETNQNLLTSDSENEDDEDIDDSDYTTEEIIEEETIEIIEGDEHQESDIEIEIKDSNEVEEEKQQQQQQQQQEQQQEKEQSEKEEEEENMEIVETEEPIDSEDENVLDALTRETPKKQDRLYEADNRLRRMTNRDRDRSDSSSSEREIGSFMENSNRNEEEASESEDEDEQIQVHRVTTQVKESNEKPPLESRFKPSVSDKGSDMVEALKSVNDKLKKRKTEASQLPIVVVESGKETIQTKPSSIKPITPVVNNNSQKAMRSDVISPLMSENVQTVETKPARRSRFADINLESVKKAVRSGKTVQLPRKCEDQEVSTINKQHSQSISTIEPINFSDSSTNKIDSFSVALNKQVQKVSSSSSTNASTRGVEGTVIEPIQVQNDKSPTTPASISASDIEIVNLNGESKNQVHEEEEDMEIDDTNPKTTTTVSAIKPTTKKQSLPAVTSPKSVKPPSKPTKTLSPQPTAEIAKSSSNISNKAPSTKQVTTIPPPTTTTAPKSSSTVTIQPKKKLIKIKVPIVALSKPTVAKTTEPVIKIPRINFNSNMTTKSNVTTKKSIIPTPPPTLALSKVAVTTTSSSQSTPKSSSSTKQVPKQVPTVTRPTTLPTSTKQLPVKQTSQLPTSKPLSESIPCPCGLAKNDFKISVQWLLEQYGSGKMDAGASALMKESLMNAIVKSEKYDSSKNSQITRIPQQPTVEKLKKHVVSFPGSNSMTSEEDMSVDTMIDESLTKLAISEKMKDLPLNLQNRVHIGGTGSASTLEVESIPSTKLSVPGSPKRVINDETAEEPPKKKTTPPIQIRTSISTTSNTREPIVIKRKNKEMTQSESTVEEEKDNGLDGLVMPPLKSTFNGNKNQRNWRQTRQKKKQFQKQQKKGGSKIIVQEKLSFSNRKNERKSRNSGGSGSLNAIFSTRR
eukprot:TRINITY_DN36_c1_g1_i1.p1 TRINITY_DN36_c1_g1~~TRINITY_DN36_c1_g1_i1.p1  ORF type:complete len:1496 (-),score=617.57 TRINITY_DN36_c1_g1_i1:223-4710(-)